MSGYDKLWALVLCLGRLLTSKIHNNFNLQKQITNFFYNPPNYYLPILESFEPPYTSPNLVQNLLSDWLWAPLLFNLSKWVT